MDVVVVVVVGCSIVLNFVKNQTWLQQIPQLGSKLYMEKDWHQLCHVPVTFRD